MSRGTRHRQLGATQAPRWYVQSGRCGAGPSVVRPACRGRKSGAFVRPFGAPPTPAPTHQAQREVEKPARSSRATDSPAPVAPPLPAVGYSRRRSPHLDHPAALLSRGRRLRRGGRELGSDGRGRLSGADGRFCCHRRRVADRRHAGRLAHADGAVHALDQGPAAAQQRGGASRHHGAPRVEDAGGRGAHERLVLGRRHDERAQLEHGLVEGVRPRLAAVLVDQAKAFRAPRLVAADRRVSERLVREERMARVQPQVAVRRRPRVEVDVERRLRTHPRQRPRTFGGYGVGMGARRPPRHVDPLTDLPPPPHAAHVLREKHVEAVLALRVRAAHGAEQADVPVRVVSRELVYPRLAVRSESRLEVRVVFQHDRHLVAPLDHRRPEVLVAHEAADHAARREGPA
mmetsp:Transcript_31475/g.72755  ORF Transcript_31475/g.72755 Transcript_31475/m.72755 type:complete len:402 (-) Transcript_31475:11-1216(-)